MIEAALQRDFARTFALEAGPGRVIGVQKAVGYDPAAEDPAAGPAPPEGACVLHLSRYRQALVDGKLILAGDRLCVIQGLGLTVEPEPGGYVVEILPDGTERRYSIVSAPDKAEIRGTVLCWNVQVRGAP